MAILFSLPHSPDEDSPAAGRRPQTPSDGFLRMGYKGIYIYWGDSHYLWRRQDGTDGPVCDLAQLKQCAYFLSHHSGSLPGLSAPCGPNIGCCCDEGTDTAVRAQVTEHL